MKLQDEPDFIAGQELGRQILAERPQHIHTIGTMAALPQWRSGEQIRKGREVYACWLSCPCGQQKEVEIEVRMNATPREIENAVYGMITL